jgi:hypothetical protein
MSAEQIMTVALVIQTTVLAINTITLMVVGILTLKVVSGRARGK